MPLPPGIASLTGVCSKRRTCWLTLAALPILGRSAIQPCGVVVFVCSTCAKATLRESLPRFSCTSSANSPGRHVILVDRNLRHREGVLASFG